MLETAIAIALVTGIVQVIKMALPLPKRIVPALSLVIGIVYGIIFRGNIDLINSIYLGIIIGLSASGLYSGGKTSIKG